MPDTFTPEQITQILEEFFRVVGTRQYIGARYVPIFGRKDETSIQWDNSEPYEPLTIVQYQGNSFTSRQYVPAGVDILNEEFWAITGNYNAQVEAYRHEVQTFSNRIGAIEDSDVSQNAQLAGTADSGLKDLIAANTALIDSQGEQLAGNTSSGLKDLIEDNSDAISHNADAIAAQGQQLAGTTSSGLKDLITANANAIAADSIKIDASNVINAGAQSFVGLTWASFGDSITYRESWQPYVIDILKMSHVNCGIGSTPLSGSNANAFWQDVRLNAVKAANPDIVTILGGANDIVLNPVIGTDANLVDKDTSTFIGAYSYIIDNLLTWKPSLRIFILSTTWAHNDGASVSQTLTYGQFAEACKAVAEYYKLPFVDLYNNSGFNAYTMGASPNNIYSSDSIHPNDAGGKVIASQVIAKMQEVMLIH